jgi:WD40 repeat protein
MLKYTAFLELDTGHVSSLDFSPSGRVLAVVNAVGEISLWDTNSGTRYNPVLRSGTSGSSSTLWIDNNILVCGLSDGSLTTCKLLDGNLPRCNPTLFVGS